MGLVVWWLLKLVDRAGLAVAVVVFIIMGGPRVLFMVLLFPWPDVRFKLDVRLARLASRSPVTIFWLAVLAAAELAATMG